MEVPRMSGLVVLLLLLALLFGGVGLFVEGLKWLLIIALVLVVASALTGYRGRGSGLEPRGRGPARRRLAAFLVRTPRRSRRPWSPRRRGCCTSVIGNPASVG